MQCPLCQADTKVTNSRETDSGRAIKRRRECTVCGQRFSTYEQISLIDLRVQKRGGDIQQYDKRKIVNGIKIAVQKRPISEEQFKKMMFLIENDILNLKKDVIPSEQIGKIVLKRLAEIDKVAYLRFASIYRDFRTTKAFEKEIQKLEKD
ncbi:MAG: transcriptional regulator NrdR [Patescibacteria group bacterium]